MIQEHYIRESTNALSNKKAPRCGKEVDSMKAILSILICLAMMVSGLAFAEPVEPPVSTQTTIDNISVQVGTKNYDLPLTGRFGVSADSESMLFDFGLDYNSDTLFPFQMKLTKDALSLLIGKSKTAYTFDAALLEGSDVSMADLTDMYAQLTGHYRPASTDIAGQDEAIAEAIDKAFNAPEENATYEGQPAKRMTGTVESDQLAVLVDDILNTVAPNYESFIFEYIQFLESIDDSTLYLDEEASEPEPEKEIDSIAALMKSRGVEISCDYNLVTVESGAGKMDFTFHVKEVGSGFEFSIPLTVTLDESGNSVLESVFPITVEDNETTNFVFTATSNAEKLNFTLTAADTNDEDNALSFTGDITKLGDGAVKSDIAFNLSFTEDEIPSAFSYTAVGTSDANMNSDMECAISIKSGALDFGFKFHVLEQDGAVEDRIASAKEKRFATDEDLKNGASMLLMRLASLAGDVETLMNDGTITEMVDAFNEMTTSYYAELYPMSPDQKTREDMPFAVPEFTYLPEGFELIGERYYTYPLHSSEGAGRAMLRYDLPAEKAADGEDVSDYSFLYSASGIHIDIEGPAGESTQYSLDADGKVVEAERPTIESPEISVLSDNYYKIEFVHESIDYSITVYDNILPLEDVPTFLAGIVWPEATNP